MAECVFCSIVQGTQPAHVLYEDGSRMAFLDRYPVVPGHTLIVPKRHHATILEMTSESAGSLFSLVPVLAPAILAVVGASAFNVGQNNGDAAKQVVPHVHVHIIPRRPDESLNWASRLLMDDAHLGGMARRVREQLRSAS